MANNDLASVARGEKASEVEREVAEERNWKRATIVGRSITLNVTRQAAYEFWKDFEKFPAFMDNIQSVKRIDNVRSRWVVAAPGGMTVEWEAVITEDVPGEVIAWESAPGASVRNTGKVEFKDAPPGRGTQITATIIYEQPAGKIGELTAKLFRRDPKIQMRQDMRRLKQLVETGEVSTARRFKDSDQAN